MNKDGRISSLRAEAEIGVMKSKTQMAPSSHCKGSNPLQASMVTRMMTRPRPWQTEEEGGGQGEEGKEGEGLKEEGGDPR